MIALIPTSEILQYQNLVETLVKYLVPYAAGIANDEFSGAAFRCSLLYSESATLQGTALSRLTAVELFYNGYYWFWLFIKLHQTKHGHDAGLEQQAYQLLETAPDGVEWNAVEEIDKRVEIEIAPYRRE